MWVSELFGYMLLCIKAQLADMNARLCLVSQDVCASMFYYSLPTLHHSVNSELAVWFDLTSCNLFVEY